MVDDHAQFLRPDEVLALATATPWPYNVMVTVAAGGATRASWQVCR
jgi:hypothetical protein